MKMLVTGAAGFIGSHLCERLAGQGHFVRGLVRNREYFHSLKKWNVEPVLGELRDAESLKKAVQGMDVVFHTAALFRQEKFGPRDVWETNVHGTRRLLDASVQADVKRFVYAGTTGVHGDVKDPPATEQTPYLPIKGDLYQQSKLEAEKLVLCYAWEGLLQTVAFETAGVYGARDLRFHKLINFINTGRFAMIGPGTNMIQMIYIDDLIDGILLCAAREKISGNAYILVNDEIMTLNRLAETISGILGCSIPNWHVPFMPVYMAGFLCERICRAVGIEPPIYRRRVNFFRWTKYFDISKARKELGFNPKIDLKSGMERLISWYQENGYL